ncbi:MAG: anti-sigma factor antagonist [Firmicutes bacterium]|nr:anti-sigma factor antagonist [Bacillota bacterium]
MQYSIKVVGQALITTLQGELDLHTSPQFKADIAAKMEAYPDIKHLIFDVKNMSFIDSSGLGVILGRYREIQPRGGKMYFVQANPQIKRVLQVSGLHKISEFVNSSQEVLDRV